MNEVRIERTFEASAEAVFDAWTDPEVMRRWSTVLLVNTGISTNARRDSQDYGWRQCLDELERRVLG